MNPGELLLVAGLGLTGGMVVYQSPRAWLAVTLAGAAAAFAAAVGVLAGGAVWDWQPGFMLGGEAVHLQLDGLSAFFLVLLAVLGGGLALPHLRTPVALGREAGILAIVLLRDVLGVSEPAPDDQPITRLVFFIAPSPRAHLEILAQLSTALVRGRLHQLIQDGAPDDELCAAIAEAETARPGGGGA